MRLRAIRSARRGTWSASSTRSSPRSTSSGTCTTAIRSPPERCRFRPGGPKTGQPPFTWEASASDALRYQGFDKWKDWSIPGTLYKLEGYNGFGYRDHHPDVPSPYLWSFSTHYSAGKYVADGKWSQTAVSAQCGVAVLLRRLAEKNLIKLGDVPKAKGPILRYAPKLVTEEGKQLQRFLNGFPGIVLREDGQLGQGTSDAFKQVTGRFLAGDPRAKPPPK